MIPVVIIAVERMGQADSNNASATPPAFRFTRTELGGALGDLGVYIPLLAGMVNRCGLQLGPALLMTGLANIAAGLLFRIPMPVQPMKAIAIVAIGEGLNESQILTAGIGTGVALLVLALTGWIDQLNRLIPKCVVRGLQLGLGVKLLMKGVSMILTTQVWFGYDSIGVGLGCVLIVLVFYHSVRIPSAVVVFGLGLALLFMAHPEFIQATRFGMDWHMPDLSSGLDWQTGLIRGAVPQIPLTVLNSVIAVCLLSQDLFPHRPVRPRPVALSVALVNLLGCPFGAMPMCHGSGGLAAQYRFGARTGGSMIMLGAGKVLVAVVLGGSLLVWLQNYPESVLGALLLFGGIELAMVCRDQTARRDFFVMIATAAVCMAVNSAVGFAVGFLLAGAILLGWIHVDPPKTTLPPSC